MAWLDELFARMVAEGASDLHLTSGLAPRFRLHGEILEVAGMAPIDDVSLRAVLYEISPEQNRRQFEKENDTDFAYELPGKARFRANFFVDRNGPGAVFRQIPVNILSAEQLGLPPAVLDLCKLSKGLVLVTGPTGSGKSTTLAAMIDHINSTRTDHVITIEDPIEFVHPTKRCLINQREVHRHTESFKRALRAALREDPDIILVGEMRDLETIEIAIETAETGHLVFGTLHTTTAPSTVDRIIDQFPADRQAQIRTMLANSLKGVVAQTLCKKQPKGRVRRARDLDHQHGRRRQHPRGQDAPDRVGHADGRQARHAALERLAARARARRHGRPDEAYFRAVNKDDMRAKLESIGARVDLAVESGEGVAPQAQAQPQAAGAHAAPHAPAAPRAPLPTRQGATSSGIPPAPTPAPGAAQQPAKGWSDPFDAFKRKRT
jgi:twitching motility protein PilT